MVVFVYSLQYSESHAIFIASQFLHCHVGFKNCTVILTLFSQTSRLALDRNIKFKSQKVISDQSEENAETMVLKVAEHVAIFIFLF